MVQRKRNVACLESLWDDKTEDRLNVVPILELISKTLDVKCSQLNCNTENEFEYNLGLLRKRNYGILYLGFHGSGGTIFLHDKSEIDLAEIAEMMGNGFSDWIIHFGSCGVLRKKKALEDFVGNTQVAVATGFTKTIDWIESAALELLLFQAFQTYTNPKLACRSMLTKYPDLVNRTGFCFYADN